jgi:hypothetical protein
MSFDNNFYPNRKDNRRVYTKGQISKRNSRGCRNHGSCGWCAEGRLFTNRRREPIEDNEHAYECTTDCNSSTILECG